MKKILALCCSFIAVIFAGLSHPRLATATDWESFLKGLNKFDEIRDGQNEAGTLYNATYTFTVSNRDGISGNFGSGDFLTMRMVNTYDSSKFLEFSGSRAQLNAWAEQHDQEIYAIMFMGAPDRSIAGVSNGSTMAAQGLGRLLRLPTNDIRFSAQYDFFEVGPAKVSTNGFSGLISYVSLGESGKHALGLEIPFRSLVADDNLGSSMMYLMLNPFYEYSVTGGANRFIASAGLNLGVTSMKSDIFDTTGFLNYGLNVGAGVFRTLASRLEGRAGVSYQYLERYIPEEEMPKDFKWLGQAINDAGAEQTISSGVGVTAWMAPETASIDVDAVYVYQLGSDVPDAFKDQTVVSAFVTFVPGHWQIRLGYKTSFGIEDFTDRSVVASLRYLW